MTGPCLWFIAQMSGCLVFWKWKSACQLAVLLLGAPASLSDVSPTSRAGHGRGALTGPGENLATAGKQDLKKDSRLCVTQDKKDSYQPVCNIPVITSLKEEEKLIESSTKVLGLYGTSEGYGRGVPGPTPALTLSSVTAGGEAAVQQKQQQVFLHQVEWAPVGAGRGSWVRAAEGARRAEQPE